VAIPGYPSVLPKPRVPGYDGQQSDAVQRNDGADGLVGMRKRYKQRTSTQHASLLMSQLQFRIWQGFWIHKLQRGAAWFQISLLTGSGFSNRLARVTGPYQAKLVAVGKLWEVALVLELQAEGTPIVSSPGSTTPGALTVTLSAASSSQSGDTPDGNLSTPSITSSVTGGVAPYTYLWAKQSGVAFGLSNGSTASSNVFTSTAPFEDSVLTAVYRLTVTDLYGSTAYDEITITHTYTSPDAFLLESGDFLLLESGDKLSLE